MELSLSSLFRKTGYLIGADISSSAVKLVELAESGKRWRLERYAMEPLPRDAVLEGSIGQPDIVSEAVRRCWRRLGTSNKSLSMALPSSTVITKKVIIPAGLNDAEMEGQVEAEAGQYIPFSLDEVNLDYQVIGPAPTGPEDVEVLLAAARKEKVDDMVSLAASAGLKAVSLDLENNAMMRAFEMAVPSGGTGDHLISLIDVGQNLTQMSMVNGEEVIYSRDLSFGGGHLTEDIMRNYGMSYEEADAGKRNQTLPQNYVQDVLQPFIQNLAAEILRAIQLFFTSSAFNRVNLIVLSGGSATLPGMQTIIANTNQADVIVANPFAQMTIASRIKENQLLTDASSLMVACGLAMRRPRRD